MGTEVPNLYETAIINATIAKSLVSLIDLGSKNEEMRHCLELAQATARHPKAAVLIIGETGTGKSLIAQSLHYGSTRVDHPCVIFNCANTPKNLLEIELFGGESPSQANNVFRPGVFAQADRGTLVLDQVEFLSDSAQKALLAALSTGEYRRVGSQEPQRSDVRIVATTSANMANLVSEDLFREDLFYRLTEVTLRIPPLRNRKEDIPTLVENAIRIGNERFGKHIRCLSRIASEYFYRHDFPGNVRELNTLVYRAISVAKGDILWLEDFGMRVEIPSEREINSASGVISLEAMERRHIQKTLDYTHGNKKRTAELLQISRPTLDRKIRAYGLHVP